MNAPSTSTGSVSRNLKRLKKLIPVLGIIICFIGIRLIFHLLREHPLSEVIRYLESIPAYLIWAAGLLTLTSYLVLSLYDLMAFRFIGRELSRFKIIGVALIAFAFGNNIGMANLAGGSVRFRLYSALGVSAGKILKVILFSTLTFWLGVSALGGILFTFLPLKLPADLNIDPDYIRVLGIFLLSLNSLYLLFTFLVRRPIHLGQRFRFSLPSSSVSLQQMAVASFDWFLAAFVLYLLMPKSVEAGFGFFLAVFVSAQMLALITNVPGGVGLLETLMIYFISPYDAARPEIMGALLAYRVIYYFAPLALAVVGLVSFEVYRRRRARSQIA